MAAESFRKSAARPHDDVPHTWEHATEIMAELGQVIEDLFQGLQERGIWHGHKYEGTPYKGFTVYAPACIGTGSREVLSFHLDQDADIEITLFGQDKPFYKGFSLAEAKSVLIDGIKRSVQQERAFACLRPKTPAVYYPA